MNYGTLRGPQPNSLIASVPNYMIIYTLTDEQKVELMRFQHLVERALVDPSLDDQARIYLFRLNEIS